MSSTLPTHSDFEQIEPQTPAEEVTVVDDPQPQSVVAQADDADQTSVTQH